MPAALYASPFPRLDLTLEEKEHLHSTANELVSEVQDLYETYLWEDHCAIDPDRWAPVRERENVHVYHDRRPGAGTGNKDMHLLLTVGSVFGNLPDAMYGVLNHTTEAMRIKTAYVKDTLLDSAVLETILEPTVEQPYQSMTVRWFVKGVPLHVRAISKHRDNVYLEATGIKQLSNGEDVGFHLMHSITFDRTPNLPQYDRFNMSICTMWRQVSAQHVQAFMTSYIEIKESFAVPMVIKSTADAIVSIWKVIECAQQKKLVYLVQNKAAFIQNEDHAGAVQEGCSVCGSHSRSARRGVKSNCAICAKNTCNKCRIKRDLSFFAPDRQLLKHTMRFCLSCLTSAHRLDASVVAQDEVPDKRPRRSAVRSAMSETASSSSKESLPTSRSGPKSVVSNDSFRSRTGLLF